MKIALIVSGIIHHKKESLAITTINYAKELQKNGHEVTIIARKKHNTPEFEIFEGVKITRIKPFKKFTLYNKLLCFPFGIKKFGKFDVIHGFSSSPLLVLRSLLGKWFFNRNAKVAHTLKSYPVVNDLKKKSYKRFLFSIIGKTTYKLINLADLVTVSTNVYKNELIKRGIKVKKIKKINSHIDLEKFKPLDKKELENKYGYKQKIVFYYGGMWEIKGIDYLINAIPLVTENNSDVKFLFAPRNLEAVEKYTEIMQKMGITNFEFILKGKIEDYVNLANVVVMPYPHLEGTEANPSCILESLACATPVITTNLPELKEAFANSVIFAEPKNSNDLANKINQVLNNYGNEDDGGYNSILIKNGLNKVKEFNVVEVTKEFIGSYHQFLSK